MDGKRDEPTPKVRALTWPRTAWLILSGTTFRTAWPIALVVGSVLSLVNQGDRLVSGPQDLSTLLRVVANYAIPYVVSSLGYLSAPREGRKP